MLISNGEEKEWGVEGWQGECSVIIVHKHKKLISSDTISETCLQ